jgi:4-aminobutyrate aminotransferase-like enzyme/Ser/Thr protein kinase RdoA (MazF antagonist)
VTEPDRGADLLLSQAPPALSLPAAERLVADRWGLALRASPLPGEWDRNVLLSGADGPVAVLKVSHVGQDATWLAVENAAYDHLAAGLPTVEFPRLLRTSDGQGIATWTDAEGRPHLARLLSYLPGRLYAHARPHDATLLASLGTSLAKVTLALADFHHPALRRASKWDLDRGLWITEHLDLVPADAGRRELVAGIVDDFRREVVPRLSTLRRQAVYNDANDYNILVREGRVAGFVDLGDMVETALVHDLAIAVAYALLDQPAPLLAAAAVVGAYHQVLPLTDGEIALLWPLVRMRLATSVANSAVQRAAQPANTYLAISEAPAWRLLTAITTIPPGLAICALRQACGLPAHPDAPAVRAWLAARTATFAPVLPVDPRRQPVPWVDLSVGSLDLGGGERWRAEDVADVVTRRRQATGCALVLGRYLEPRLLGGPAEVPGLDCAERRTVPLGVCLFMAPGTAVTTPLAGRVAALERVAAIGAVLLRHEVQGGPTFFTRYGGLDLASLAPLEVGQTVAAGSPLATIGPASDGLPPHLDLQVVVDAFGLGTGVPTAVGPSERDLWAELCPDPNLILGVPGGVDGRPTSVSTLLARRAERLGPSLSVSYRQPLHLVRGYMQHLWDADGQRYLDMVNNVPHVGHANPRVVTAAARQLAVLNTNTRYLHPLLEEYSAALVATLPAPLTVCFFVNSGSEANELALRLARTATSRRGTVVVDAAYHGNTGALIDISPYKHDGPGGGGAPPWVRKVALPDAYRGRFRGPGCGPAYAALVDDALDELLAAGHPAGVFITESMLGCGGQVVLPDGYLPEVFRRVRAGGGVCIADEVQVGLGRAGSHFWAFEQQGVVPDIVTLGKPIGNGWPLGAVVTTPAIAARFANGMEYFNTFGGNQASLAVGLAVLAEIAEHGLQARALAVGNRILDGLRELQARHSVLGDVRGLGLYIGAELVRDRERRDPHAAAATHVANRLRDFGTLISTDGPDHNVLKIKPPLVVTCDDADLLIAQLDRALGEDAAQA